jgi:hypothetical protein
VVEYWNALSKSADKLDAPSSAATRLLVRWSCWQGADNIGTSADVMASLANGDSAATEAVLGEMQRILDEDGRIFVSASKGVDKAQHLSQLVQRNKDKFGKVFCVDANSFTNFLSLAPDLGVQLGEVEEGQEEENVRLVRQALESCEVPYLLVLENVDNESGLEDLLPREGACQVRRTSG